MKNTKSILAIILSCIFLISGCADADISARSTIQTEINSFDINSIPEYSGKPYVEINNNIPYFTDSDYTTDTFEEYSPLDSLGRCGTAYACIGKETMPDKERENIGMIKPTGWHTIKYKNINGLYLYNRCHLIGYQLSAENSNERNLITGTRNMNVGAMLNFENIAAEYINRTENHILYRVMPVFEGENLLASGVLMEGRSVEDSGAGVCFNVFCYNEQPGIIIDHSDGSSYTEDGSAPYGGFEYSEEQENNQKSQEYSYILNKNTKKFHYPECASAAKMKEENKEYTKSPREEIISRGYTPCKICSP